MKVGASAADATKFGRLDRRDFIKASGGLVFLLVSGGGLSACASRTGPRPTTLNAWVRILPDDTVLVYNPAIEMGQGSMTALPVVLAEEMDADWDTVKIEDSPIDAAVYGHDGWGMRPMMAIVGSYAVQGYYNTLRRAGAEVRLILRALAAEEWGVGLDRTMTEPGRVVEVGLGRSLSFGELADLGRLPEMRPTVTEADLKAPGEYRLVGTSIPRRDVPAKVDGSALYSGDIQLPGMVHGSLVRAPMPGSAPLIDNLDEVRARPGVLEVFSVDAGVAVIAETIHDLLRAKADLQVEWAAGGVRESYDSQHELSRYGEILDDSDHPEEEVHVVGDPPSGTGPLRAIQADYLNDYVYHAQMEPLNAVVSIDRAAGTAEVWVGTQAPDAALADAAQALGLSPEQVTLHRCYLGGGFGRRAARDYLVEACRLARRVDRPLKLTWTREDDLAAGMFRPASLQRMSAHTDGNGEIVAWSHRNVGPGRVLLTTGTRLRHYAIPHQRVTRVDTDHGVPTRSWRAEGHGANIFAIEGFLDEISDALGRDPLALRRRLLRNSPRALRVVDEVASMAGWDGGPPPRGRMRGIAFCDRNSLSACVVEISLDRDSGRIRVHRVWIALDAGLVVQPDNARAQVEGAVIMGIGTALSERVTFSDGRVEQSNFTDYSILRCEEAPESIDILFVPTESPPSGIGEAGLPAVGAAIANAFARLTSRRLRHMPFTPDRVREVLVS